MKYASLCSVASLRLPSVFNSGACETVTIMRDDVPVVINKSDYDEDRDGEIFEGNDEYNADGTRRVTAPAVSAAAPASHESTNGDTTKPAEVTGTAALGVVPRKKKNKPERFFIIDTSTGKDVSTEGIEAEGYETNAEAWKVITDIQMNAQS
jgi:hypothetical protein